MPWKLREIMELIYQEESLVQTIVEEHMSQGNGNANSITDIFSRLESSR